MQEVTTYADGVEGIAKKYAPRVFALLRTVRKRLENEGFEVSGLDYMCGDDYRWSLLVQRPGAPEDLNDNIDLSVRLDESLAYDGTEDGINWSLDVVHGSGLIVGGVTPYNYTPKVWVEWRSVPKVEERWLQLANATLDAMLADDIREWFENHPRKGG